MLRELVQIVTRIVIALDDNRSVRRNADVPADKTDLRNDHGSLRAHLQNLIPHREYEALKDSPCHGMLLVKNLSLINREIRDLTGLLINGRGHAAAVEVIHAVAVVAESAASAGDVDLTVPLDGNKSYRIDRIRLYCAYSRVLDDHLLEEVRALLIDQALIDGFGRLCLAVHLLDRLAAGA